MKRVEYVLSLGWRDGRGFDGVSGIMIFLIKLKNDIGVQKDLHKSLLLSNEMTQFIHQLQYYYQFEVLESSWQAFLHGVESEEIDYSMLIRLHVSYLKSLVEKGLLGAKHKGLMGELEGVFRCVFEFVKLRVNRKFCFFEFYF